MSPLLLWSAHTYMVGITVHVTLDRGLVLALSLHSRALCVKEPLSDVRALSGS